MTRFDATGRRALWTSGQLGTADLTTSPQAQQQQQKRSIHMVHKPVNSVCYRHQKFLAAGASAYKRPASTLSATPVIARDWSLAR